MFVLPISGSLIFGISGGFTSIQLDADAAYQSNSSGHHNALYTSWNEGTKYIDLSLSYSKYNTKNTNIITTDDFDVSSLGCYFAIGKEIALSDKTTITPELSYQRTNYEQDEYLHNGFLPKLVKSYKNSSDLISFGLRFATEKKLYLYNRNLAMIPEFRTRWTHEINPHRNDLSYQYLHEESRNTYSVNARPRERNFFQLGVGLDCWNWRYFNTKFELDFDYLKSESYNEKTVSGKFTLLF